MAHGTAGRRSLVGADSRRAEDRRAGPAPAGEAGGVLSRARVLALAGPALAATALYALISLALHARFRTGFDLALFDQVVWNYSRFDGPGTTLVHLHRAYVQIAGPENRIPSFLGEHFSPLLVVLAPLYWVWADARMLLLAQAALVGASTVPVYLFARDRLPRTAAVLLAAGYALNWGVLAGISSDFHEVAFAPFLIALAILLVAGDRPAYALAPLATLLLVKESFGIFVAFFGLYLLVRRAWRPAIVAIAAGSAWFFVVTGAVIPHFRAGREYAFWSYPELGSGPGPALVRLVRDPTLAFSVAVDQPAKAHLVMFLLLAFLFVSLYSPLVLLALPLLAERVLSSNHFLWSENSHHSLAIAPVLAMAAADGLRNLLGFFGLTGRNAAVVATAVAAIFVAANVSLSGRAVLGEAVHADFYRRTDRERAAAAAAAVVPAHDGSVATQGHLSAHLSERRDIDLLSLRPPLSEYLVYEETLPPGSSSADADGLRLAERRRALYRPLFERDGFFVGRLARR